MKNIEKAIKSGSWITFSTIFQTVFQFLQISILARILSPSDFGIVAISNTVIVFFGLFANLGFSNSIISKQENDKKVLSSIFFLGILLGFITFLITFFASPLIVHFYKEPRLGNVIKLSSLSFLIIYFSSIYSALLQKELRFKTLSIIDLIASFLGISITIILAYKGFKELSLVFGALSTTLSRTILQIMVGRKLFFPSLDFYSPTVKEHLKFGIFNFGDGIVGFIQANWDNIIIGRLLGARILGFYTLASQLAIFPTSKINPIILQVAFPVLAN